MLNAEFQAFENHGFCSLQPALKSGALMGVGRGDVPLWIQI